MLICYKDFFVITTWTQGTDMSEISAVTTFHCFEFQYVYASVVATVFYVYWKAIIVKLDIRWIYLMPAL